MDWVEDRISMPRNKTEKLDHTSKENNFFKNTGKEHAETVGQYEKIKSMNYKHNKWEDF